MVVELVILKSALNDLNTYTCIIKVVHITIYYMNSTNSTMSQMTIIEQLFRGFLVHECAVYMTSFLGPLIANVPNGCLQNHGPRSVQSQCKL